MITATFDWSISIGTIISTLIGVLSIIATLLSLHKRNVERMGRIEWKVDTIWEWFVKTQIGKDRGPHP